MGLLESLMDSQNSGAFKQLAGSFGIGESDARKAVASLLPAISRGMRRNTQSQEGLGALTDAVEKGDHQRYLDEPQRLGREETIADGNKILGHLLGSKDVSRQAASQAAASTGLDTGLMKKLLPVVATMAMGAMGKQAANSSGSGLGGMLSSFLDADKDGSVMDDVLGVARKLF